MKEHETSGILHIIAPSGEKIVCGIMGTVYYDDFPTLEFQATSACARGTS